MRYLLVGLIVAAGVSVAFAQNFDRVRRAVCAGVYYPPTAEELAATVRQYINEAEVIDLPGPVVGAVVPFASYPYTGSVAAHAFKPLQKGQYKRVIILAPSVYASFENCSIPLVRYYQTLLGNIEVDGPAVRDLILSTFFEERSVIYNQSAYRSVETQRIALHEREWAAETVLPFLQEQLGPFKVVPIVVGSVYENGEIDMRRVDEIAREIRQICDDSTLVVAVSNFTQYGDVYDYTPFLGEQRLKIGEMDMEAISLVETRNATGFASYLNQTENQFLGRGAVAILMRVLDPGARGVLLSYNTSSNISGRSDVSTSYAAIAFFDPTRPKPKPAPQTSAAGEAPADAVETAPPALPETPDTNVGSQ